MNRSRVMYRGVKEQWMTLQGQLHSQLLPLLGLCSLPVRASAGTLFEVPPSGKNLPSLILSPPCSAAHLLSSHFLSTPLPTTASSQLTQRCGECALELLLATPPSLGQRQQQQWVVSLLLSLLKSWQRVPWGESREGTDWERKKKPPTAAAVPCWARLPMQHGWSGQLQLWDLFHTQGSWGQWQW